MMKKKNREKERREKYGKTQEKVKDSYRKQLKKEGRKRQRTRIINSNSNSNKNKKNGINQ